MFQGYHGIVDNDVLTAAAAGGDAQLTRVLGPIDQLVKLITVSVYGLLVLVAIFAQGSTAIYYFTRKSTCWHIFTKRRPGSSNCSAAACNLKRSRVPEVR